MRLNTIYTAALRIVRLVVTTPHLALMMSTLCALISLYQYNQSLTLTLGPVSVAAIDPPKHLKIPHKAVIANYGIYREVFQPRNDNPRIYQVQIPVVRGPGEGPAALRVHAKGCIVEIRVNDALVPLRKVKNEECLLSRTRYLDDFSAFLHGGVNTVQLTAAEGGEGGFKLRTYPVGNSSATMIGTYFAFAFALLAVLVRLRFNRPAILLALGGLFFCIIYYFGNDYLDISPDITGHLEYIDYLVEHHRIPPPLEGWQTYHPPLYYILCAAAYSVWETISAGDPYWGARFVSLILYLGFLVFSMLIIRRWVPAGPNSLVAMALVIFWTMGTASGGSINNDVLSWLGFAFTIWALMRWYARRNPLDLGLVLAGCGLAFLAKNNALLLVAMVLAVIGYAISPWKIAVQPERIDRLRQAFLVKPVAIGLAVLVVCAGMNIGRTLYYSQANPQLGLVVGNRALMGKFARQNPDHREGYFRFDYHDFIRHPFNSGGKERQNLPYFWNTFFETWLFGKDSKILWPSRATVRTLALLAPLFSIFIVALTAWRFVLAAGSERHRMMPWLIMAGALIGGLVVSRINVPLKSSVFVRYVYVITTVAAVLLGQGLHWLDARGYRTAYVAGMGMARLFILLSLLLMLSKAALVWGVG